MPQLKIFLLLCMFIIPSYTNSKTVIAFDNEKTQKGYSTKILQSDNHSYKVRIKIHSLNDDLINVASETYHRIAIEGGSSLEKVGEPSLPTIIQHVGIPNGCMAKVSIQENQWYDFSIGKVFPSQNQLVNNDVATHFLIEDSIYGSDSYLPQILNVSEKNMWKGIGNIYIEICPFRYYPQQDTISVLSDFTLQVDFLSFADSENGKYKYNNDDLCLFDNRNFGGKTYVQEKNERTLSDTITPNYLIVVGNIPSILNSQELTDFCRWKSLKGYKTKVVSTQIIGSDSASIKNYIAQQVENGIEQVLFIGDQNVIPIPSLIPKRKTEGYPVLLSDYWYGCLDGNNDNQAEVPIGRFIVGSLTDFRNIVNKTIMYERGLYPFFFFFLLFANAQHNGIVNYLSTLETIRNGCYQDTMNYVCAYAAPPEAGGNSATATEVFNHINNGINLAVYNGHSLPNEIWLNDTLIIPGCNYSIFDTSTCEIDSDRYFVFVSTGCQNGNFTASHSMMRSFTQSDHCAIAYLGDTYPMYTYEANSYLIRFFERLLDEHDYHIGHLNLFTHLNILGNSYAMINNAFGYICAGDPSLELWTGVQKTFQDVNLSLIQDSIAIIVGNTNNYKVNVVNEAGVLLGSYVSENGCCKIPANNDVCYVNIDKHNYIPYIIHIDKDSHYIQDTSLYGNSFYYGAPMKIGYDVTATTNYGNVSIMPGAKVQVLKGNGVTIKNGFECKLGAEFIIK